MNHDMRELIRKAKNVLQQNWMGNSTKPAPRLYPHQWSWDSAFIAIGYAHFDQSRAMQEMRSLFQGQWKNGMLPHIVFNPKTSQYSPGPEFWQIERSPNAPHQEQTSGIVQPPIHTTAIWHIYRYAQDREQALNFLQEMFPCLVGWHEYLYHDRDPFGEGLVCIRHPWESGQDNSPIWDRVLSRIELTPDAVPFYRRVDTHIVDSEERPSDAEYDRYAYLVKIFRDHDYDEALIRERNPFLVQDVFFNTLLVQANRDLAQIARVLGEDPARYEAWAVCTQNALNAKLWDEEHATYFDYDLVADQLIHAHVAAGFSPLYAGVPTRAQADRMLARLNSGGFCLINKFCWAVPSYDRKEPGYAPNQYWRGPIWINVNWVLYHGLRRYGYNEYARRVKLAIIELPRRFGFHEYFDPDTGGGHGSENFSWTAALMLDLLLEQADHHWP